MIQHEPRWLNDNQQALWRLMLDAIRKLERDIEDTLQAEAELTSPEFAVLVVLFGLPALNIVGLIGTAVVFVLLIAYAAGY